MKESGTTLRYLTWGTIQLALVSGRLGVDTRSAWGAPLWARDPRDWIFPEAAFLASPLITAGTEAAVEIRISDQESGGPLRLASIVRAIFPSEERRSAFVADLHLQELGVRAPFPLDVEPEAFSDQGPTVGDAALDEIRTIANKWRAQLAVQERISAALLAAHALGHPAALVMSELRTVESLGEFEALKTWCAIAVAFEGNGHEWSLEDVKALAPRLREYGYTEEAALVEAYETALFGESEGADAEGSAGEATSVLGAVLQVLLHFVGQRADDLPLLMLNRRGAHAGRDWSIADELVFVAATFGRIEMPSGLLPEHPLHGRQGEQAGAPYPALWDTMVEEELRAVAPRIASEVPAAIPVTNRANEGTVPVKLEPHAHGTLFPEEQIQGGISGGKAKGSRRRK
jgi:hypothetical protein